MGDASSPHELRLEDLEWLRSLARRLVRDPHRADDAVQDALVRALERGASARSSWRAWLAAVLRNAVRQERRTSSRREAREAVVSAREPERSTLAVVEELALHRRLADEVHALDEPYRTAILLCYLRGRSADEIAGELGVPVKTVRSRVDRGLARLRERMGRDREQWLACLGLLRPSAPVLPAATIAWFLSMKLQLVVALVGVSLVGAWLVARAAPEPTPLQEPELARAVVRAEPAPLERPPSERPRAALDIAPPAPAPRTIEETPAPEAPLVRGFVRTLDGAGVEGLEVVLEALDARSAASTELPRARSGPGGRFELPLVPGSLRLDVTDERYACIVAPHLDGKLPLDEPVLVVAPRLVCDGRVVQRDREPVAGAYVAVTLPGPIVQTRDVGGAAVHFLLPFAETSTDELGAFRFERIGFVPGAVVSAGAEGFEPASVELPAASGEPLEIVLAPSAKVRTIHGLVLEASGAPAARAQVSTGGLAATCGDDGAFVLECEGWRRSGWLRALRPPALPGELALEDALRTSANGDPVVLRLGPPALSIRGRVLDADGAPVPGAAVFTPDTTPFGAVVRDMSGHAVSGEATLEACLTGELGPGELTAHARAAADGTFELEGLLDRTYALFVLDPRNLRGAGPIAVRAGSEHAELALAAEPLERVAGRVLSRRGTPLAGVEVTLGRSLPWNEMGDRDARWTGFILPPPTARWRLRESVATTDAEGRFELGPRVTAEAFVGLRGDAILFCPEHPLDASADPAALEIVVDAASRFHVALRDADEADAFMLSSSDGEEVVFCVEVEGLQITAVRATIDAGRSGTVLTQEGEYEVVLFSGEREVRREPVLLLPGVHEIEL